MPTSLISPGTEYNHSVEYPGKSSAIHRFFLKDKVVPQNGYVTVSDRPGMGMALNPEVIERERYLTFEVS